MTTTYEVYILGPRQLKLEKFSDDVNASLARSQGHLITYLKQLI